MRYQKKKKPRRDVELTPHCHEHGEQDRTVIIEQQAHLRGADKPG